VSTKLHVSNLGPGATDVDVERLFSAHGRVLGARVSTHPDAGPAAESAIVDMASDSAAAAAVCALDGSAFAGRPMAVARATTRNETDAAGTPRFGPMNMTADDHDDAHRGPLTPGAGDHPGVPRPPSGCPQAVPGAEMQALKFTSVPPGAAVGRSPAPGLRTMFAGAPRTKLAPFGVSAPTVTRVGDVR